MAKNELSRLIIVAVLICAAIAVLMQHRNNAKEIGSKEYWVSQIQKEGPARAYAEFANDVSSFDPSTQHGDAHIFGNALFATEGLSGISACDDRFSYGCYHEFISQALLADGLSVLPEIDAVCKKAVSAIACRHGIGHGLLAYFGYGTSDLKKAVAVCAQIGDESQQGCLGGVFMEYNMRIMTGLNNARPLEAELFAPCNGYSGAAQQSCMFYQPQWWWTVLPNSGGSDKTGVVTRMISLCEQGPARVACMEGVGLMVPTSVAYDEARSVALCTEAAKTTDDETYCITGAATVFAGISRVSDASAMCATLTEKQRGFCMQYSEGSINVPFSELPI